MKTTYGNHVLRSLKLPQGDIDGDTTLTLSLELVEHPSYRNPRQSLASESGRSKDVLTILEGALAEFGGFLLELFNGTLVDTTALVDQVTGGGGLAGIDVSDDCGLSGRGHDKSQA